VRKIKVREIEKVVEGLCFKANTVLRPDVLAELNKAFKRERSPQAKENLKAIIDNARIAKQSRLAICQDTGLVVVYIEIGEKTRIAGGNLEAAVNGGVETCYKKGCFRKSVVKDPIKRRNTGTNTPCLIYTKFTPGSSVKITVMPKGFGSENKSRIKMFRPTASVSDIKDFVIDTARDAGPEACPPFVIGVGIGGTFDKAAVLAKEALFRPINRRNPERHLARLEKEILSEINNLNIGPMGLGGKTTALGVNASAYPTHIAGMPVAVNISCHATRGAVKTI